MAVVLVPAGLDPRLLAAAEADDLDYYRDRLEDPELLDAGVTVHLDCDRILAVPVGGLRRGGFLPVQDVVTGLAVRALLAGRPGFPDVRLRWSADIDICHNVEWGERPPQWWKDAARGRFYGYRADAVARFLARPPAAVPAMIPILCTTQGELRG